jgi:hypothetical protein
MRVRYKENPHEFPVMKSAIIAVLQGFLGNGGPNREERSWCFMSALPPSSGDQVVPEKVFFNEFGQRIRVRLIGNKIMVCHEGIKNREDVRPDGFFEYVKDQVTPLPPIDDDSQQPESPADTFDIVSPPKPRPRKRLLNPLPDDSPQHILTEDEKQTIEHCALELRSERGIPDALFEG